MAEVPRGKTGLRLLAGAVLAAALAGAVYAVWPLPARPSAPQVVDRGGSAPGPASAAEESPPVPFSAVAMDRQNGVDVLAAFANADEAQPQGDLVFIFELNNHSIDLANLALAGRAVLQPEPGSPVTTGFQWRQEGVGHHVSGYLTLRNADASGKPLVTTATKSLTLELRDVAGAPLRTFRFINEGWQVPTAE